MSDEVPVVPTTPAVPFHRRIQEQVKEFLAANASPRVREMVVNHLTAAELDRRRDAVLATLTKLDEQAKNLRKLEESGAIFFDRNNQPVGPPTFTKDQLQTIKQAREQHEKLQNLLANAFEKNEWAKLLEQSKSS